MNTNTIKKSLKLKRISVRTCRYEGGAVRSKHGKRKKIDPQNCISGPLTGRGYMAMVRFKWSLHGTTAIN